MKPLQSYIDDAKRLGKQGFLRATNHPVMVHTPPGAADGDGRAFKTSVFSLAQINLAASRQGSDPNSVVYALAKRPGGPYPEQIGVGRARNADVYVEYPEISKFHAYFTQSGQWAITDAGATNGTFVDGVRLQPNKPQPLRDGSRVGLGPHAFIFFTAEGFYNQLLKGGR